ncbi:uncharacterized protein BXZ73DRAFT_102273 [Epithele typhae]|uniref:uncharacterized protein n=1 Tax=Epithele typhae TaxID=378194 RepID=UPI0020082FB1|nr:uncharacterized protein BXZ73DRAFT_102273 [Epithele typhae]KAH9929125.1 hypothetical protein BXZ73DRAFT_102273 [Epithele typhae]
MISLQPGVPPPLAFQKDQWTPMLQPGGFVFPPGFLPTPLPSMSMSMSMPSSHPMTPSQNSSDRPRRRAQVNAEASGSRTYSGSRESSPESAPCEDEEDDFADGESTGTGRGRAGTTPPASPARAKPEPIPRAQDRAGGPVIRNGMKVRAVKAEKVVKAEKNVKTEKSVKAEKAVKAEKRKAVLVPEMETRPITNQRHSTTWYFTRSVDRIQRPPHIEGLRQAHLYVHHYGENKRQMWIWDKEDGLEGPDGPVYLWRTVHPGSTHPKKQLADTHTLLVNDQGNPAWVTNMHYRKCVIDKAQARRIERLNARE